MRFLKLPRIPLKVLVTLLIAAILLISVYVIFFTGNESNNGVNDSKPPMIDAITGNTTGTTGKIATILVTFSDNVNVTKATIYYKAENAESWSNISILSGSVDIEIPSNPVKDWYYYITIDDAAGNGPVGNPSTDGSVYYTITVSEAKENLVHNVFIEEGTATWCTNCPTIADILHDLYESKEHNFYYVSMVGDKNDKAESRLEKDYNISGYPTVFIDGGYSIIMGANNPKSTFEEEISRASKRDVPELHVNVTAELDETEEEIETLITIKNYESETYNGRLKVYLTEKIAWQYFGGEGSYHFGFLDYIVNENVAILGNDQKIVSETYDVSKLDPDNLMVIAVVFNSESTKKYADPPSGNPFDAYYADATYGTEVVEGGNLPPEVGITNPIEGRLHLFGKEIMTTPNLKTILVGRTSIVAQASDESKVEKVEFYIDDELVAEFTEGPYEWKWKTPSWFRFKHTIKVVAYDDEGKPGESIMEVVAFILL